MLIAPVGGGIENLPIPPRLELNTIATGIDFILGHTW
jgi:hypothetical protein